MVSSHCLSCWSRPRRARSSASKRASSASISSSTTGRLRLALAPFPWLEPLVLPLEVSFNVSMVAWLMTLSLCLHSDDGAVLAFPAQLHDSLGELGRRRRSLISPHLR